MKRIVWTLLAIVIAVSACGQKEDPTPQGDTFKVSPSTMSFMAKDASTKFISVTAKGEWTATASDDWITINTTSGKGNGSVSVTVSVNEEDQRTGSVNFVSGKLSESVSITQGGPGGITIVPAPASFDNNKRSNTAYQLLIYSFADSDGDGIGDFKGIQNKLDYLDKMGVTALWLSPAHPTKSYHAYDVDDYYSLNPLYGTEQDFKNLLDAAHAKGIEIYMDYVLNHSGKNNAWFQEALANPNSKYRDYYFFSKDPKNDYSKFPMLKGTTYQAGEWRQVTSGSPKLTITSTTEAVTSGNLEWNLYMWQDGVGDKSVKLKDKGDGTYYAVLDISGKWGILVRKYKDWSSGSKFGAKNGSMTLQLGTPVDLVGDGADMWFTGSGRYKIELTNLSTETLYYMGCFSDSMPDLNYGDVSVAESNPCFQDLAASADKWINMGIDGLRLDAVKHICGGIASYNHASDRTLLAKWYEHCNATYKAAGHNGNIFMVAEEWDGHDTEKLYYKSLTSCFEFDYGYALRDVLKSGNASGFATKVAKYVSDHTAQRADAVTSFFLSNHDQNRFASEVGETGMSSFAKRMQAGAIILSGGGKPWIYQGEELGYWGKKDSGDEYVRTPILWDKAGKECAKKGVESRVDASMLKADISVEAQLANTESILNVYKTWSELRNTYPALAIGEMSAASISGFTFAAWYMTSGSQKLLVIHNVAGSKKEATVSDDMSHPIALLGTASYNGNILTLGPNSSVVFEL